MDPIVGQITLFGGNFAPRGWAFCDGQLLKIEDNQSLFALLGTTYGGDGRTSFGLPDLRGRVPMHAGAAPGLSPRRIGEKTGAESVALDATQLPEHDHELLVADAEPDSTLGGGDAFARVDIYVKSGEADTEPCVALNSKTVGLTGGSAPHNNMQPTLCINYIIALQGVFPSRN